MAPFRTYQETSAAVLFPETAPRRPTMCTDIQVRKAGRPKIFRAGPHSLAPFALAALLAILPGRMQAQVSNWQGTKAPAVALQPEVRVPVGPIGYMPPGELPAFGYASLVALHFIDSGHLLFSFNILGLLRRSEGCPAGPAVKPEEDTAERLVRTVVLRLPTGKVEQQVEWQLQDEAQYLWGLDNGEFLFRRCSQLELLDATLAHHPIIELSGPLLLLGQSPDHQLLLLEEKRKTRPTLAHGTGTNIFAGTPEFTEKTSLRAVDIFFLQMRPLGLLARSRAQETVSLPLLPAGFLEVSDQGHDQWAVNLQPFQGTLQTVGQVHSACAPGMEALTDSTFLAIACKDPSQTALLYQAYDLAGHLLWQQPVPSNRISMQFEYAANRSRMAISTLHTTHSANALGLVNSQDADGQIIDVYDTQTGNWRLSFRTSPIYTAGQNFALSPGGHRLAVLHDGFIEIYNLDALPSAPSPARR